MPSSGSSSASASPREGGQALLREHLAQHGGVFEQPSLVGERARRASPRSAPGASRAPRASRSGRPVGTRRLPVRAGPGRAACAPSRRRRAGCLRPLLRMLPRSSSGRPGTRPVSKSLIASRREWLEVERAEPAPAGSPGSPLLGELGPRKDEDEQREAARPLQQVLDEVEQSGVSPLHVLEHENGRRMLGEPFEEDPPGGEEILLVTGCGSLEREQVGQAWLDPLALRRDRRCARRGSPAASRAPTPAPLPR